MPSQQVEIAETLAALRRKLRREKEVERSQPAQFATNRGNKLRPGARYVQAGSLPFRQGKGYKEKVNHAGFQRYILDRNPRRFNGIGDELDDSESDADADADAEEENPYGDIKLEELLRPLTHPSELANHPSLSQAYLDTALPDMVLATDAKIRQERDNLWRAKNLYRHFTGDETWIPCERVEAAEDWELFEPNPGFSGRLPNGESPGKKRRLNGSLATVSDLDGDVQIADAIDPEYRQAQEAFVNGTLEALRNHHKSEDPAEHPIVDGDVSMTEQEKAQSNGTHQSEADGKADAEQDGKDIEATEVNQDVETFPETTVNGDEQPSRGRHETTELDDTMTGIDDEDRPSTASTPPPPARRITRALAAEAETNSNPQIASPPPTSPTISSNPQSPSSLAFQPHPMFLLPPQLTALHTVHPSYSPLTFGLAHSGLPPEELLETRKLLSLYIQKSEETLRGLEGIFGKLVKAKRRRDKLWEWCIAEGHVGEMSDGEDWIDVDRWGMSRNELRKGRDEDSGAATGENGAVATAAAEGDVDAQGAVVMGGRKGKRRRNAAKD